jgi:hypothetical protein
VVIQVLIDRIQFTLNPFRDPLPRGSGLPVKRFQVIYVLLEAASLLSAQLPSRSAGEQQKAFGASPLTATSSRRIQEDPAQLLEVFPCPFIEIRFRAGIVVVLKGTIENQESNFKEFRHKDSNRFSFSALSNEHRRTRDSGELCKTSSSGASNRPTIIG